MIPVKDRTVFVHEAVRSVQAQSLDAFELLLCDDDSEAPTLEIMQEACRRDPRLRIIPRGPRPAGGGARRNDGAMASTGRYLVFLDSDDILRPDCLRDRVAWMERHSELGFCLSECRVFEQTPGDTPYGFNIRSTEDDLERFLRHDFPWQTTAPTWRRDAFTATGGWDDSLPSWQDWDLHVRALIALASGSRGLAYARTGATDYYYRRTRGVALEGFSGRAHLHTRRALLAKISRLLVVARPLESRAARLLAGLYFSVGWSLACAGFQDEATALWRDAGQLGLVRRRQFREGDVLLRLARHEGLRPTLQRYRYMAWPVDLHHTPSKTMMRAWALPSGRER